MDCRQALGYLSAWSDGLLDAAEGRELQAHLAGCSACAREAGVLRRLSVLLGLVGAEEPPAEFRARLVARLVQRERQSRLLYVLAGMEVSWAVGLGPPGVPLPIQPRPVLSYDEYVRGPRPTARDGTAVRFIAAPGIDTGEWRYGRE